MAPPGGFSVRLAVTCAVLPGRRLLGQQQEMAFVTLWVVGENPLSGLWALGSQDFGVVLPSGHTHPRPECPRP